MEGYNGCLFAYGQTGSGKTFTMQGAGDQRGIIPTLCSELFAEIQERNVADACENRMQASAEERHITVVCSVLEIYNEKVKEGT